MCSSVNIEHQPASKNADTLKNRRLNNHTTLSVGKGKYEKNLIVGIFNTIHLFIIHNNTHFMMKIVQDCRTDFASHYKGLS